MKLTWTCHICGDERPDARISVFTKPLTFPEQENILGPIKSGNIAASQNIRHCNDREACVLGAETFSFLRKKDK